MPPKIKLPPTFGKRWRYGTGDCPVCGGLHAYQQTLLESGGSKAYVEVLLANLQRSAGDAWGGKKLGRFMIGALVPKDRKLKVLIACSGVGTRPEFLTAAQGMSNTVVCPDVAQPVQTRAGMTVPQDMIASCKVDNEPLACAAPKLIDYANRHGYPLPYDMTEIWVDPQTHTRFFKEKKGFSIHGHTIESCRTCMNVVPMLMCMETIFTSTS
jgi:hypothetical protein